MVMISEIRALQIIKIIGRKSVNVILSTIKKYPSCLKYVDGLYCGCGSANQKENEATLKERLVKIIVLSSL